MNFYSRKRKEECTLLLGDRSLIFGKTSKNALKKSHRKSSKNLEKIIVNVGKSSEILTKSSRNHGKSQSKIVRKVSRKPKTHFEILKKSSDPPVPFSH